MEVSPAVSCCFSPLAFPFIPRVSAARMRAFLCKPPLAATSALRNGLSSRTFTVPDRFVVLFSLLVAPPV